MYRKVLTTLLIISSLILNSCSCTTNENDITDFKINEGTDGLTLEIIKKALPKEVNEEEKFPISFEIRNEGANNIEKGILILSTEEDLLETISWNIPERFTKNNDKSIYFNLAGKSLSNHYGEKQVVSPMLKTKDIEDTRNRITTHLSLSACYPYKTTLSDTICIDTDPNDLNVAQKTCKAKDITASSQGAPVAITKINQRILPGESDNDVRLELTIYAENKGKGILLNYLNYEDVCLGKSFDKEDYNTITLTKIKFSDYEYIIGEREEIECSPNPMRETKEGYYTKCTMRENNGISKNKFTFETPLIVEIAYGYKEIVSEDIDILDRNIEMT